MRASIDDLSTLIGKQEAGRLDNIMYEIAQKIQGDVVGVTYNVIDAYYEDYTKEKGRKYIRTDEYKHPHGKGGRFRNKSDKERGSSRRKDISLRSAIKRIENNEPAIGVCRPLDKGYGYQAGVVFDEEKVANHMKHSVKGDSFTEWDILENFIFGVHGDESVYMTTPLAGDVLYKYIHSYKHRFDRHYNNSCRKYAK
jgi:hypothetical protein